ncbi:Rna/Rnp Complex-1-Interacting Phosphatase [Manis pentadactyla]|nr:Rna/Rnp Complex-1-Interacting Phosphatase [Manis pentadactyla]
MRSSRRRGAAARSLPEGNPVLNEGAGPAALSLLALRGRHLGAQRSQRHHARQHWGQRRVFSGRPSGKRKRVEATPPKAGGSAEGSLELWTEAVTEMPPASGGGLPSSVWICPLLQVLGNSGPCGRQNVWLGGCKPGKSPSPAKSPSLPRNKEEVSLWCLLAH